MSSSPNVCWQHSGLSRDERWGTLGTRGGTIWLTGLPSSGKSTLGAGIEAALVKQRLHAYLLDGDNLRHGISSDLGFSREDRERNVLRVGELASLFADSGAIAVVALVSPFAATRAQVRALHERQGLAFIEVFVNTPLLVCVDRDPKGHYARALGGDLENFTGIDDPYEEPTAAELELTPERPLADAVDAVFGLLRSRLGAAAPTAATPGPIRSAGKGIAGTQAQHAHAQARDALTA